MTIQLSAAAAVFDRPLGELATPSAGPSSIRIHPHSKSFPETILITRDVQMLPYAKLEVYLLREVFRCSPANSAQILRSTVADIQQLLEQLDARLRTSRSFHQIFLEQLQRKDIAELDLLQSSLSFANPVSATEVISMNFSEPVEAGAISLPCSLKQLLNDQNLVVRAQAGDTAAFVELGERHSTKVRRTVYRITRNWEDAEDALQESLLKGFRHLNGFENRSSFSSWLTRIAINSALMTLRKRRACKEVSIDSWATITKSSEGWNRSHSEDPERRYARCEREELLKRAMLQLTPGLRNAIQLQQVKECPLRELAERLGISRSAAKSRLLRARLALQECP